VGLLLLAHACLQSAPYGSLAARGRADPSGGWKMDESVYTVVWILMALGYTYSGYTKLVSPSWLNGNAFALVLNNPLARPGVIRNAVLALPAPVMHLITWGVLAVELSFAPLSLSRKLRPWAWTVMLLMHLGLTTVISFADLSLGMVMLHLFTFNPSWIAPLKYSATETIFYDGHCGLCHRAVRFVLSEDARQMAFRFAPLDSYAFRAAADEETRRTLPDSLVVETSDGRLLTRSSAVLDILVRLGGVWKVVARLAGLIPPKMRDFVYDLVASVGRRLFRAPAHACPLIAHELRARFEP
jgi:predicted DCC family thiol-disulfide oxidoreductase YuxK